MALGCSTNTVLHLPAIAHEAGIDFDLNWVNEASAKVPNLCHLAPAGHHHVIDLHLAGGVMGVLSELKGRGLLDENALTVSGMTLGEEYQPEPKTTTHEVIRPFDEPYSPTGGLMILRGNLAPDGAVVKRSAVAPGDAGPRRPGPRVQQRGRGHCRHLRRDRSSRATWWSSVMKARRAAPACVKCWPDQRDLRHGAG